MPVINTHEFSDLRGCKCYYIRVDLEEGALWKVGVTSNTVAQRFKNDAVSIKILQIWEYNNMEDARKKERAIRKIYFHYLLWGSCDNQLEFNSYAVLNSGNTEMFTEDVLGLDDEKEYKLINFDDSKIFWRVFDERLNMMRYGSKLPLR
jgi:hypothetical protein